METLRDQLAKSLDDVEVLPFKDCRHRDAVRELYYCLVAKGFFGERGADENCFEESVDRYWKISQEECSMQYDGWA